SLRRAHLCWTDVQTRDRVCTTATKRGSPVLTTTALTTAERRALQQIKTSGDRFAVIAADHGQPLVDMLDGLGVSSAPDEQRALKSELGDNGGRAASAVLLGPDVSMPDIVDQGVVPRDVGLIVRIEADG